jgi:hypothetical protein
MSQQHSDEWRRLLAVSSPATGLAGRVEGLTQVLDDELPRWLTGLGLPVGWSPASVHGHSVRPSQTAVRVAAPQQGGYGCDTLTLYRFTGTPSVDVVERYANTVLNDLHAEGITSRRLVIPSDARGVAAVCVSGFFSIGALPAWAQCCTYAAGSPARGQAMLLEHSLFIESRWLRALQSDVVARSRAVHAAVVGAASLSSTVDQ